MRLRSAIATARLAARLADDVLVELGDDLPRRQRVGRASASFREDRSAQLQLFDRDRARSCRCRSRRRSPSPSRRSRARRDRCCAPAPWPRPARTARPIRSPRSHRRARSDRRCRTAETSCVLSSTISIASSRRRMRSVRQSLASSTAERSRLPRYCSSFDFEPREQRERVGRRAGEPGEDAVVVEPPDLLRALLDDGLAEGHLAVAGQHRAVAVPDRQDRRAVKHRFSDCIGRGSGCQENGTRGLARGQAVALSTCKSSDLGRYLNSSGDWQVGCCFADERFSAMKTTLPRWPARRWP